MNPTRTIDVAHGHPLPDVSHLDGPATLARKREVEALLPATKAPGREAERAALRAENEALDARLRELREAEKREGVRRNFAGIGSPLHEACVARLSPGVVAELEADAMGRLGERERRAAERRGRKGSAT